MFEIVFCYNNRTSMFLASQLLLIVYNCNLKFTHILQKVLAYFKILLKMNFNFNELLSQYLK